MRPCQEDFSKLRYKRLLSKVVRRCREWKVSLPFSYAIIDHLYSYYLFIFTANILPRLQISSDDTYLPEMSPIFQDNIFFGDVQEDSPSNSEMPEHQTSVSTAQEKESVSNPSQDEELLNQIDDTSCSSKVDPEEEQASDAIQFLESSSVSVATDGTVRTKGGAKVFELPQSVDGKQKAPKRKGKDGEVWHEPKDEERASLSCQRCDKTFKSNQRINQHFRDSHGPNIFRCDQVSCSVIEKSELLLWKHKDSKHFICKHCHEPFKPKHIVRGTTNAIRKQHNIECTEAEEKRKKKKQTENKK
jgi:hypothetical protein